MPRSVTLTGITRSRVRDRSPSAMTTRSASIDVLSIECHGDVIAVIGEFCDLSVEAVFGAVARVLDQDAGQFAAQDLQFGGRTADAGAVHRKRRGRRAVGVDESHADLGGVGGADLVFDTHSTGDLARRAAHVDVVSLVAALREPLDDRGLPAPRGELMGERGPGDTGTGDQRMRSNHPRCISPISASETLER